jgi:hypothetical protein
MGLTVVGTVAMGFAIWSGIVAFEFYTQFMHPALPLDGGARIVGIVMADTVTAGERSPTLHDFVAWRVGESEGRSLSDKRHAATGIGERVFRRRSLNSLGSSTADLVLFNAATKRYISARTSVSRVRNT